MTRLRTQSLMIKQFVNLNTRVLPGKPRVAHANPGMIKPSILWTGEWSRKAHDRNKTSHHYRQATVALAFVGCALSAAPPACFACEQQSMPWRCWNQLVQWQTVVVVAACGILVHDLLVVALVLAVLCLLLLLLFFFALVLFLFLLLLLLLSWLLLSWLLLSYVVVVVVVVVVGLTIQHHSPQPCELILYGLLAAANKTYVEPVGTPAILSYFRASFRQLFTSSRSEHLVSESAPIYWRW